MRCNGMRDRVIRPEHRRRPQRRDRQGRLELRVQDIFRRFRAGTRARYPFSFEACSREDFEGKGQADLEVHTAFPFFPFLPLFSLSRRYFAKIGKKGDKIGKGKSQRNPETEKNDEFEGRGANENISNSRGEKRDEEAVVEYLQRRQENDQHTKFLYENREVSASYSCFLTMAHLRFLLEEGEEEQLQSVV